MPLIFILLTNILFIKLYASILNFNVQSGVEIIEVPTSAIIVFVFHHLTTSIVTVCFPFIFILMTIISPLIVVNYSLITLIFNRVIFIFPFIIDYTFNLIF